MSFRVIAVMAGNLSAGRKTGGAARGWCVTLG
jgi:hypothetical protein